MKNILYIDVVKILEKNSNLRLKILFTSGFAAKHFKKQINNVAIKAEDGFVITKLPNGKEIETAVLYSPSRHGLRNLGGKEVKNKAEYTATICQDNFLRIYIPTAF